MPRTARYVLCPDPRSRLALLQFNARQLLICLMFASAIGCDSISPPDPSVDPPIETVDFPDQQANREAAGNAFDSSDESSTPLERKFAGISFQVPSEWAEFPASPFVDAKFAISRPEGELTLSLTTMGGGIDANLQRWIDQFEQEPGDAATRKTARIDSLESQWVDVRGTFASSVGNDAGPHSNWRLVGIAIPVTPRPFFIKLTGPRDAVGDFLEEFQSFLDSARIEEGR